MTREEAINNLNMISVAFVEAETKEQRKIIDDTFNMAIKALEQEPKTGRWIEKDGYDGDTYYDCSECGESWTTIEGTPWNNGMKYCPNCGANMGSEEL